MRGVVLRRAGTLEVDDLPEPALEEDGVLIDVAVGGICGSDLHAYAGHHPFRVPPVVLGHEVSGRVRALGPRVKGLAVGDSVTVEPQIACGACDACRADRPHLCLRARRPGSGWSGTFAERFAAPAHVVYRLPERASLEDGALAEPAAVAFRAVRRGGVAPGDCVAVLGCGPIGALIVAIAQISGATVAVASDVQSFNRRFATNLGVQATVDPRERSVVEAAIEQTAGRGVDVAFVTSSGPHSLLEAVGATRRGGKVVSVALHAEPITFDATMAVMREVDVLSSLTYSAEDFRRAVSLVGSGVISAQRFVTHRYPFTSAPEAFADLQQGMERMKVLLDFEAARPEGQA